MSQQRGCKPVCVGDAVTRSSVVKAAGDTVPCARPNNNERSKTNKNKIPKRIRYDLESALVGLCDVWFEEIKPHLIRNNIKLHVEGMGGEAGPAAGDHEPPAASRDLRPNCCNHLDPGAAPDRRRPVIVNYAGYCSTQPTASKAPSRKPPILSPSTHLQAPTTCNSVSLNKKSRGRSIKRKPSCESASPAWQNVRACHTYSVLRDTPAPTTPQVLASYTRVRTAKSNKTNPLIQTPKLRKPSCESASPAWQNVRACHTYSVLRDTPAQTAPQALASYTRVRTAESNKTKPLQRTPKLQRNNKKLRRKVKKCTTSTQTERPYPLKSPIRKVAKRNSSIQCDRCPGNTALNKKSQGVSYTTKHESTLDDLIADLENKRVHLLYQSTHSDDVPSVFNLVSVPYAVPTMRRRRARKIRHPPWK